MSNAVSTESTTPVGGVAATGQSLRPAVSTAEGGGRRISADSFKLLTARLKRPRAEAQLQPVVIPDLVPKPVEPAVAEDLPLAQPQVTAEPLSEPSASAIAAAPEAEVTRPIELLPGVFEPAESGEELKPALALELPAFQPLDWQEPDQLSEPGPESPGNDAAEIAGATFDAAESHDSAAECVDLPGFQPVEPVHAAGLEVLLPEPEARDIAELLPDAEESSVEVVEAVAGPELQPLTEPTAAESIPEIIEAQPELAVFDAAEAPEESAASAVEESAAPEPIERQAGSDLEPVREALPIVSDPQAFVPELEEASQLGTFEAEAVAAEEAEPLPELEAETAAGEDALSLPLAQATAVPSPELPDESVAPPEAKPHTSEMAGRVVEAMMKTISNAIYAKPSASERAAFLREMAALMHEAAGDDDEATSVPEALAAVHRQPEAKPAAPPAKEELNVAEALAGRIGPSASPLLKPAREETVDPFASPARNARRAEPRPAETIDADEESGELALTLLDMMSGGTGSLPHERTLAADTLLRILPRIPVKQLLSVVERVAIMETPPPLLVAKLIRDARAEIVAPLLERCSHISDQDLMNAAPDGDAPKLRMIARRRMLSTVLSDYLIEAGDPGVLLTLIRNPGASLSHEAFVSLAEHAEHHHGLLAPLTTRADLPPPVAFELFWHVPPELRRFIFSRFLTDSETLNKILRITLSTQDGEGEPAGDPKFPPRDAVEAAVGQAAAFRVDEAAQAFADMAGITKSTACRILSDTEGEPVTVLLKALGCTRARFEEALTRLRLSEAGVLRQDRNPEELQAIFDGLSFNKARILLTYWDWFMRNAGPYAPHN